MLASVLFSAISAASAQQAVSFDIPSQPLAKALYAFSAATGVEVMVDARQAAGRQAPEVKGAMPPREALAILLAGSELVAREVVPGTVTLAAISPTNASTIDNQRYFADVQRAVERSLCADVRTSPGGYRLAFKLWVGPSGQVTRAKRLDTTGDRGRDEILDDMLPKLDVGQPPPRLAQPIALVVSPSANGVALSCAKNAAAPRGATIR